MVSEVFNLAPNKGFVHYLVTENTLAQPQGSMDNNGKRFYSADPYQYVLSPFGYINSIMAQK